MSVLLRPETEQRIRDKVTSGQFRDADSVISEALELMEYKEQYDQVRALIAAGLEQIERGETVEWTEDSMAQALERARERSRLGLPISDHVKPKS
ncbi:MAG: type II toxin-antitoxin system ParD family antitoxin [Thermomicrobiales bacterium]|jgi:putative addiction module CopG family antidote|nr:type II toxin-antitoxin system ParD family antitoxin [Thermomicrobiales bacterium]